MTESGRGGLSYVVRRGDLRHRTKCGVRRFATTGFDDELLAAVDAAAAAAMPLALVVPLPAADIPVVLGAATLVAEVARSRSLDVTATVVSRRLSQRASYDQLYIGPDRLGQVIPRARLSLDGRLETIGAARCASRGSMVFTSDPARATRSDGAFVVDGTGADAGDLSAVLRRGRRLVYVTDNPFDGNLQVIRDAGGVVWAFDPAALAGCRGLRCRPRGRYRRARRACGTVARGWARRAAGVGARPGPPTWTLRCTRRGTRSAGSPVPMARRTRSPPGTRSGGRGARCRYLRPVGDGTRPL